MHTLADFFSQNIILIYFLYGLSFFSMGLAVLLESGRSSEMRFAIALRPLAVFGLMHGIHEWGEMFQKILRLSTSYQLSPNEEALRPVWLAEREGAHLRQGLSGEELRRNLLGQIVSAQEAERQRIARELDGEPGETLTAL